MSGGRIVSIEETVDQLVRKYGTRDPFRLARESGIHILRVDSLSRLKGFYRVIKRNRFIFLNSKNTARENRIVCGHELGHDVLHREFAEKNVLQEFMLYDMSSRREYEANLFLAELLLEDEETLGYIREGLDAHEIARITKTDTNLVTLKCDALIRRGYPLRQQSYDVSFLKN